MSPEERRERHILVVDDDDRLCKLIKEFLSRAGFRVTAVSDAAGADRLFGALDFDLMVLDVMMPGEDGMAFTKRLRFKGGESGCTPILMLTACDQTADRIEGLSSGVDDYLGKLFEPQELLLRIEVILCRSSARPVGPKALLLGRCTFEADRGELTCDGEVVCLTEAEVTLLRRLARSAHEPVDRLELVRDIVDATGRAVDVQVTRLRRKIEPDPKNLRYLQTVRGIGYRLAPD